MVEAATIIIGGGLLAGALAYATSATKKDKPVIIGLEDHAPNIFFDDISTYVTDGKANVIITIGNDMTHPHYGYLGIDTFHGLDMSKNELYTTWLNAEKNKIILKPGINVFAWSNNEFLDEFMEGLTNVYSKDVITINQFKPFTTGERANDLLEKTVAMFAGLWQKINPKDNLVCNRIVVASHNLDSQDDNLEFSRVNTRPCTV